VRNDFVLDKKSAGPWLGNLSARWPNDQICNSAAAAENARNSRSHFIPRRLYVVRNGLDLARFQSSSPSKNEGQSCISGIGYLFPAKRWDRLIIVARELKRRGFNCVTQIVGDGPLRGVLEHQVQELGLGEQVKFLGHVDDIPTLLANTTFLVHTADNEGCPNAVMEAMACGLAVVAMDAGDIPFLVDDEKTGFLVPRGNIGMLIERMIRLITDCELRQRMGEAARAKAEREFGLKRLVKETLNAYRAAGWKDG
jgi:glycosyltransferase involved in cell wall biosynthesis